MAKPDEMPSKDVIDGFKGLIDFYYWKGIPVARRWPRYFPRTPSPAEATIQTAFAYINRLWSALPLLVVVQLTLFAARSTLTGKDFLVRGYIKGLYDLMPPEYYATQETLEAIRLLIAAITDYATQTTLAAILTELELKADLTELQPVTAKGGDKIFAFESIVEGAVENLNLAAGDNWLTGTAVPAGKVWILTCASYQYVGTPPTDFPLYVEGLATSLMLVDPATITSALWIVWEGQIYLQAGDFLQVYIGGATATDDAYMRYAGVQMDAP